MGPSDMVGELSIFDPGGTSRATTMTEARGVDEPRRVARLGRRAPRNGQAAVAGAGPPTASTAPIHEAAGIPVFGDYSEFSTLLVHVGTDEVLLGDAVALARRASLAWSDVTLRSGRG
jgi:hypothetical protein